MKLIKSKIKQVKYFFYLHCAFLQPVSYIVLWFSNMNLLLLYVITVNLQ